MCLATQFQKFRLDPGIQASATLSGEQDLEMMVQTFRHKIVQCLVLSNYAKGGPYVLETLMLYVAVELFLCSDAQIEIYVLLGTIVQLAMHMGYHRDPMLFKNMSPFSAEMRKRIWATLVELDIGISAQMGLPRLIKPCQTDTPEPSNLRDTDFEKGTAEMPPSRPQSDLTPMLYRLAKARMIHTIGLIYDFVLDTRASTHTKVQVLEDSLQKAYMSIPECLKWHSMAHCIMDAPQGIMQKVSLEMMFHRARILLHRNYLHCMSGNVQFGDSQKACLDAALQLLEYQHVLQEETQPFCRLYQERWRVSSLVNHDFLLATSILCSLLQKSHERTREAVGVLMIERVRTALQRSYDIWLHSSSTSKEARKAARALRVVLDIRTACAHPQGPTDTPLSSLPHCDTSEFTQGKFCGIKQMKYAVISILTFISI